MLYTKRFALVGLTSLFLLLLLYHAFISTSQSLLPGSQTHNDAPPYTYPSNSNEIDWSRFAYAQYATNVLHLCNSVMLFERLHALHSKASRLLLYPSHFSLLDASPEAQLLLKARDTYNAELRPIEVQNKADAGDVTWAKSYTKLLAFNQTDYARLLLLDSDATVRAPMDELFLLPPAPVAMCRAYWETQPKLSGQIVLLEPSTHEFARLQKAVATAGPNEYELEILNALYRDSAIVLPHRIYDLYTREFTPQRDTGANHEKYLGGDTGVWDPDVALQMAKFVHFSDWPLPKPWLVADQKLLDEITPPCVGNATATEQTRDCRERDIWLGFYEDFRRRRKEVCGWDTI